MNRYERTDHNLIKNLDEDKLEEFRRLRQKAKDAAEKDVRITTLEVQVANLSSRLADIERLLLNG